MVAIFFLTDNPKDLQNADFHIIAVPTPIDDSNIPDLSPPCCRQQKQWLEY